MCQLDPGAFGFGLRPPCRALPRADFLDSWFTVEADLRRLERRSASKSGSNRDSERPYCGALLERGFRDGERLLVQTIPQPPYPPVQLSSSRSLILILIRSVYAFRIGPTGHGPSGRHIAAATLIFQLPPCSPSHNFPSSVERYPSAAPVSVPLVQRDGPQFPRK